MGRRRVIVSLSGAGAGALYLSEALAELGVVPDLISGTSSGAIVALYARLWSSGSFADHMRGFQNTFLKIDNKDVWAWRRLGFVSDFLKWAAPSWLRRWLRLSRPGFGLVHFGPLHATINRFLDRVAFRAGRIGVRLVAIDRVSGERVVYTEDDDVVTGAVASSAAELVQPVFDRGAMLMDGGLRDHSPWRVVYDEALCRWPDGDFDLYIISTNAMRMSEMAPDDWSPGFVRDVSIAINEVGRSDLELPPLHPAVGVRIVRPGVPLQAGGHEMSNKAAIMEAGRLGAEHARASTRRQP